MLPPGSPDAPNCQMSSDIARCTRVARDLLTLRIISRAIMRESLMGDSDCQRCLIAISSSRSGSVFVVRVERIAAGDEAVARGGRAVAERAADALALQSRGRRACRPAARDTTSTIRPRPTKSTQPSRTTACATCGKIVLQVGVAGADERHVGQRRFALPHGVDLPRTRRRADPRAAGSRRSAGRWPAAACADCSTGCRT